MDDVMYPQGNGGIKSRYNSSGVLIFYHPTTRAEIFRIDPSLIGGYVVPGEVRTLRTRLTIAQVNAGATLLAALASFKYRMLSCLAIAIGGAVGAVTTVDVLGVQTTAVKLVAYAQASLTRSTVLTSGGAGAAVLADGASYVKNDVNTAITVGITGSDVTTATHVDFIFNYTVEP